MPDDSLARIPKPVALPDPAVDAWLVPLDFPAHHLQQCSTLLSCDEQVRTERFQFAQDRRRYVVAHGMLRVLLGSYLGISPTAIEFAQEPHGKPYVAAPAAGIHFNLSHSVELALCAISRIRAIGADIECLARAIDHERLAHRFFSAGEYAELQRLPAADRKGAFLTCWTRKEAIVKATGAGLRMPLDEIEVTVDPAAPPRVLTIPAGRATDWALYAVDAGPGYVATIALHRAN